MSSAGQELRESTAVLRLRVLSGLVGGIFLGQFLSPLAVQPLTGATGVGDAVGKGVSGVRGRRSSGRG